MDEKLDKKLCEDFPLLYKDRNGDMRHTCMVFGFPGNGWESLIRELSSKLEPLIQKYIKDNPNLSCSMCGCEKENHYGSATASPGKCLAIHKRSTKYIYCHYGMTPRFVPYWLSRRYYKIKQTIVNAVNWILALFYSELYTCFCEKYEPSYPRAIQVKEKFAILRFYMTSQTEEMSELIRQAEEKSAVTCENCGEEGKCRKSLGWILTLCDKCYKKHLKKREERDKKYHKEQ